MSLQVRPLSYALGAEISGIDIRESLDAKTVSDIYAAYLNYSVLLFRGTRLTRAQHLAFSRQFGELDKGSPLKPNDHRRDQEYPEILLVTSKDNPLEPRYKGNDVWHTDYSFTVTPASASLLRCVEIPALGGDTMISNMYLAYGTLSEGMQKLIGDLYGVHVGAGKRTDNEAAQPLVRLHPETGRKALFVSDKVTKIVGMTEEESRPLINFLSRHGERPQFVYRHQWQRDDLLMWDNRCTNHIAVNDYDNSQVRLMERTIIKGTPSGYVYREPNRELSSAKN